MRANLIGIPNQAKYVCQACCEHVSLRQFVDDGIKCVEAICMAGKHPSVLIRGGQVVGTSA
jgi:hypothetical protein